MPLREKIIAVTIVAVVTGALFWSKTHPVTNGSPALSKTEDSLTTTRPAFDSLTHSAVAQRDTLARAARVVDTALVATSKGVERARVVADTLAARAATADSSAAAWRAAYEARTIERDSLGVEVTQLQAKVMLLVADTVSFSTQLRATVQRDSVTESVNERLATAIKTAGQCRIVGPIPCPTRLESVALGFGLGALAARR